MATYRNRAILAKTDLPCGATQCSWHLGSFAFPHGETQEIAVEDVINEVNFDLVAAVPTDDPDVAFLATNHIDEELKEAKPFWYLESRSSSVGDVVVTPNGFAYLAMPYGWSVNGQLA